MPKPMLYRHRLYYFLFFLGVFLIGFPILLFYSAGYTLDEAFGLSARGGIYVFTPESNTSVFVGNELKNRSGFFNRETLIDGLKPDQYLVLASNNDYWPWAKFVTVKEGIVEPLFPLLVPKVIEAEEVVATDDEYKDIIELFEEPSMATATPVVSGKSLSNATGSTAGRNTESGVGASTTKTATSSLVYEPITRRRVSIWLDGSAIFAQWKGSDVSAPRYFCMEDICTNPIRTFSSLVPVRKVDFYPNRNDAIIMALDNGVYAVEIDPRTYQNFYPLYRGQEPDFRIFRNQVYIKDGDYLVRLTLEL